MLGTRPPCAIERIIITALAVLVAGAAHADPPTTQPRLDPAVDRILTQLENRRVDDLQAKLAWRQRYLIDEEEDATLKLGRIWYQDADPVARFLIHFDAKIASGRKDKLDERHLFDGRWYVELQSRTKTVTRRELRQPDDPSDPYKVGEGVFPLPFGQKKTDILREFEVEHIASADTDPDNTDHLRLTPREGTRTHQTYRTLDFWVRRDGPLAGLPVKVRVAKRAGTGRVNSYISILFDDIKLNTNVPDDVFNISAPPGYQEIVERLEPVPPPKPSPEQSP